MRVLGRFERLEHRWLLTGTVEGTTWDDLNADGIWDTGEPALAGVHVYLDANDNRQFDTGETDMISLADDPGTTGVDETGTYSFSGLADGPHFVGFEAPTGYSPTYTVINAGGTGLLTYEAMHKDNVGGVTGMYRPQSLDVSPDGKHIYLGARNDGTVAIFSRDAGDGSLSFVNDVSVTAEPTSLRVSPDGKHVYVTAYTDTLAVYSRNETSGDLTWVEAHKDGTNGVDGLYYPDDLAISPDGKHVYVAAYWDNAVTTFSRDATTGALTFVNTIKDSDPGISGLVGARAIDVSPDGEYVYVGGAGSSQMVVFTRNATTGQLTLQQSIIGDTIYWGLRSISDLRVSPDGKNVYTTSYTDDVLAVYQRDPSTGDLTWIEGERENINGVGGLDQAWGVAVAPTGEHVYAVGRADDTLAVFARDSTDGFLTFEEFHRDGINGVDGLNDAFDVIVSPDGNQVYAVGNFDNAISHFTRDSGEPTENYQIVFISGSNTVSQINFGSYDSPPEVNSIALIDADPSNNTSVQFSVTFNEPVTGVDTGDFALTVTGVSGASVDSVTGSGTSYTVTVLTGTGDGTIRLDVTDDGTIVDACLQPLGGTGTGNGDFATGPAYTIDKTAPNVSSISAADTNPSAASTVNFTVVFDEAVENVATGDFALVTTAVTGTSIDSVSGSGDTYMVTVNTGSGDGTIRLDLEDIDSIGDPAGNLLGGSGNDNGDFRTGDTYTIKKTVDIIGTLWNDVDGDGIWDPNELVLAGVMLLLDANGNGVFDAGEATDVSAADGTYSFLNLAAGTQTVVAMLDPDERQTHPGTGGSGRLTLTDVERGSHLDGASSTAVSADGRFIYAVTYLSDRIYVYERFSNGALQQVIVNGGLIDGLDGASDVTLSPDGTQVFVAGTDGDELAVFSRDAATGLLTFVESFAKGSDGINALESAREVVVSADGKFVYVAGFEIAIFSRDTTTGALTYLAAVPIQVTLVGISFSLDEANVYVADYTNSRIVVYDRNASTGLLNQVQVMQDRLLGTDGLQQIRDVIVSPDGKHVYTTAYIEDAVAIFDRNASDGLLTYRTKIVDNVDVTGLDGAFSLDISQDGRNLYTTSYIDDALTVWHRDPATGDLSLVEQHFDVVPNYLNAALGVTVSSDGEIVLATGYLDDAVNAFSRDGRRPTPVPFVATLTAGQIIGDADFGIADLPPLVDSIVRVDSTPANDASVQYTVTFDEAVTGVDTTDFVLTLTGVIGGATVSNVTGSDATYTVTVETGSGDGTLRLDVSDNNSIIDADGDSLGGADAGDGDFLSGQVYTIDKTTPVVTSITRVDASPTDAATVDYAVDFSETVDGVDAADFAITATQITDATISNVTGSGATWTVTINTGTGNGTLRLDLADDDSIVDNAGNALGGSGAGNGNSQGPVYAFEKIANSEVHGVKWNDVNGNGVQGGGEAGLSGWTLYLDQNVNGRFDAGEPTAVTDGSGAYAFAGLFSGSYAVAELPQAGWEQTFPIREDVGATRVSVASAGTQGNDWSDDPSISADGRYVAFESQASNLVAANTGGGTDVYVYDRQTNTIEWVSIANSISTSFDPAISGDGRYVAFYSYASNLVAGDTNGSPDVFVYDRQTQTVERVSVASDGTQANGSSYARLDISYDGRYVTFRSAATNLAAGDTNGKFDIFVHDRQTGVTERVSVTSGGVQANHDSYDPKISDDGRNVVFESGATNLVSGDTSGTDVFLHDRQTGNTRRIAVNSNDADISDDGRFVAFNSFSSSLIAGDTNGAADIFVYDLQTDQIERISLSVDGSQANDDSWSRPSLSADGRFVAFSSDASNLVPGDINHSADVFVYDRQLGRLRIVSLAASGAAANGNSDYFSLSADGTVVAFTSDGGNVVEGDTNNEKDVFVTPAGGVWIPAARIVQLGIDDAVSQVNLGNWQPRGSISGEKWKDRDRDQMHDANEVNLENWQIYIDSNGNQQLDGGEPSTLTAADGSYSFTGLTADTYAVREVLPVDWDQILPGGNGTYSLPIGVPVTKTFDFEDLAHSGQSIAIGPYTRDGFVFSNSTATTDVWLVFGPQDTTNYAGSATLRSWNSIAATQWLAREDQGLFTVDSIDLSRKGWTGTQTITFIGSHDTSLPITQTIAINHDALQTYTLNGFTDIRRLEWYYGSSSRHQFDNVVVKVTDWNPAGVDFGNMIKTGEIHGTKWMDSNRDGVKDAGEPRLEDWTVFLDADANGQIDAGEPVTQTDANGDYAFLDIEPDTYNVAEKLKEGWIQTNPGLALAPAVVASIQDAPPDGSGDALNANTGLLRQTASSEDRAVAEFVVSSLAGAALEGAFFDFGIRVDDSGGAAVRNFDVAWYTANGQADLGDFSATASPVGSVGYDINNSPVHFRLDVLDGLESLLAATGSHIGFRVDPTGTDNFPSVLENATLVVWTEMAGPISISLGPDETKMGVDFGNWPLPSEIRGSKWHDLDGDGSRDTGEPALSDWTIYLDSNNNGQHDIGEPATTTDANGDYSFGNLATGIYTVAEIQQPFWGQTYPATDGGGAERINVSSSETQTSLARFAELSVSDDGRYVTFLAGDGGLVAGDTNRWQDVFVRDRRAGTTEKVSGALAGAQANHDAFAPSISGDGRYVAFSSLATNLVTGDTNDTLDVFMHDRVAGTTQRVSVDSGGTQANSASDHPIITSDGRYIVFESWATNLVAEDTNARADIFVHDRTTGATERVSTSASGAQANDTSVGPSISSDGRYVVFLSKAASLVTGDTNGNYDVFVKDRQTGSIERIVANRLSPDEGRFVDISSDGRFVVFSSPANGLVAGDNNGNYDVFLFDRQSSQLERVTVGYDGAGASGNIPSISDDGRMVVFSSSAGNLVRGDTNGLSDIFVFDSERAAMQRLSVPLDGNQANGSSSIVAISGDGRHAAFESLAFNLIIGDTNQQRDIFAQSIPLALVAQSYWFNLHTGEMLTGVSFGNQNNDLGVTDEIFNVGSANRSGVAELSLDFEQAVMVSSAIALRVRNHTTSSSIDLSAATLQGNGTSTVTWDLSSVSLPDGRYTAELPAAEATIAAGLPLTGTHTFEFHVLQGDVSGDGAVNFADYGVVGSNFDPLPGTRYRAGDADGDGLVNFADYGVIGANFNPLGLPSLIYDLGDAPQASSNYPTTLAKDGAIHIIGSGLFLGASVDAESDGQPNANALGDDNVGDDEDGVTFGGLTAGSNADITVVAKVPLSLSAVLNAWIDFNADGDWSDLGEQIFTNEPLTDGSNARSFSISATAAVGDTFARFRVTTSAGYSFTGLAPDGEVEDYKITIAAANAPAGAAAQHGAWTGDEQISTSGDVLSGGNVLASAVPAGALDGDTAVRFDLNSDSGLLPTGAAPDGEVPDGEVEDYVVTVPDGNSGGANVENTVNDRSGWTLEPPEYVDGVILHVLRQASNGAEVRVANTKARQNPINSLDANRDGDVTAADVLIRVNRIDEQGAGRLPVPMSAEQVPNFYYDADGDDYLSPLDVLLVVNFLDDPHRSESEGKVDVPSSLTKHSDMGNDLVDELFVTGTPIPTQDRSTDHDSVFSELATSEEAGNFLNLDVPIPAALWSPMAQTRDQDLAGESTAVAIEELIDELDEFVNETLGKRQYRSSSAAVRNSPVEGIQLSF